MSARRGSPLQKTGGRGLAGGTGRTSTGPAQGQHRDQHRQRLPLSDNLYALMFIVLADLSENQIERLTPTLTLRGCDAQSYTFNNVREVFMELFCMPKSSLDNPNLRAGGGQKLVCILEH